MFDCCTSARDGLRRGTHADSPTVAGGGRALGTPRNLDSTLKPWDMHGAPGAENVRAAAQACAAAARG